MKRFNHYLISNSHLLLLLAMVSFFVSCNKQEDVKPDVQIKILPKTLQIIEADNDFGFRIFKLLNENAENTDNIFISPTSISLALAMTYNGAKGNTKTAMEEALQKSGLSVQEINEIYQSLSDDLVQIDPEVQLTIANSIWYKNTMNVEQDFITTNQNYYHAMVSPLDFSDPMSVNIINNWVATNTNNKIKTIIESISPFDRMFLINAIYFKGKWKYQFDESNTFDRNFYPDNEAELLSPFMYQETDLNIVSSDLLIGAELPYGDGDFSMVILMPQSDKTIDDLLGEFTSSNWNQWIAQFELKTEMDLFIPKFKFEYKSHLKQELASLGMGIAFSDQADFSGISTDENLFISDVLHKTFIEVNEEGTEAAAVTSVTVGTTSVGPINEFVADRPFLFVIKENSTNAIVFMGRMNKPQ
jgi:serine protease inhibitor